MKCFLFINVKMPLTVGILTSMRRNISNLGYLSLKKAKYIDILIFISISNFMLSMKIFFFYLSPVSDSADTQADLDHYQGHFFARSNPNLNAGYIKFIF